MELAEEELAAEMQVVELRWVTCRAAQVELLQRMPMDIRLAQSEGAAAALCLLDHLAGDLD